MTLIEVLVAAFVLGVGLLGVAALQMSTMKVTTESLGRSQAVMLAEFMADRIRANLGGATTYDGMACDASGCNKTTTQECGSGDTCTADDIARLDASQWQQELSGSASHLGAVTGTLALDANGVWAVRIYWDDSGVYGTDALNRDSASALDCAPQDASNKASLQCYQVRLVP